MNLNSILIGSENPTRLAEYYSKLFGTADWDQDGFIGWKIGSGFLTVGPHADVKGKNATPGRILINIETPDVRAQFDKLSSAGAIVVQEPYSPNDSEDFLIATFADPDDNYFQLMSPMD